MNVTKYEEKLKEQYLLQINSLENAKGILEFQINQLTKKIDEIEFKQESRLYVKNKTESPIFIGNLKLIDFVSKKSFLENVPLSEAELLYQRGDVEDIDREEYLNTKKIKMPTPDITIPQISCVTPRRDDVFMGEHTGDPVAVKFDIEGVKDIKEKKYYKKESLDSPPDRWEIGVLARKNEKGLLAEESLHLFGKNLKGKLKKTSRERGEDKGHQVTPTKKTLAKKTTARKNVTKKRTKKRAVKKTDN